MGRQDLLTPLFVELRFSFGLDLPSFTSLSRRFGL